MIEIINLIYSFSEICNINLKYKIMKKSLLLILSLVLFVACGKKENSDTDFSKPSNQDAPAASSDASSYDPNRGEGKFDKVDLAAKLDQGIMNFITNPDPMIDKDPEVQAQLEICLVRMPNQGLKDDEARSILEYMRKIDGVK